MFFGEKEVFASMNNRAEPLLILEVVRIVYSGQAACRLGDVTALASAAVIEGTNTRTVLSSQ
jgi:hypothetical protein